MNTSIVKWTSFCFLHKSESANLHLSGIRRQERIRRKSEIIWRVTYVTFRVRSLAFISWKGISIKWKFFPHLFLISGYKPYSIREVSHSRWVMFWFITNKDLKRKSVGSKMSSSKRPPPPALGSGSVDFILRTASKWILYSHWSILIGLWVQRKCNKIKLYVLTLCHCCSWNSFVRSFLRSS